MLIGSRPPSAIAPPSTKGPPSPLRQNPRSSISAEDGEGEAIVDLGDVDVGRPDPGHRERARRRLGEAQRREVRTLRDDARRIGMALGGAHHVDRPPRQVPGALRRADDDGGGAVALEAAVEQPEGVGDHARGLMVLDRDGRGHDGVAVERRVPAGRHGDLAELATGGPVELHVTTGHGRVELHRRERPHRHLELADDAELRHLADAGADPAARGPVAAERDQDVTADAGRDHRQGALHGGDRAGAAHGGGRREPEVGNAEVGDEVLRDHAAGRVGDDAVDVRRRQPGIGDRRERGLHLERHHALAGVAAVGRLTDPGDRAPLLETHDPVLRREAARPRRPSTRRAGVRARHSASTPGLSNVTRPRASSGSLTWVVLGAYAHPKSHFTGRGGAR